MKCKRGEASDQAIRYGFAEDLKTWTNRMPAGIGRPEVNSHLQNWTAEGQARTQCPRLFSTPGSQLRDPPEIGALAGELRMVGGVQPLTEAYHGAL
jgi:hypothetical protein